MAALTSIRNPVDLTQTLVFFTTNTQQVGYEIKDEKTLDEKLGLEAPRDGARAGFDEGVRAPTFGSPQGGAPKNGGEVSGLVKHPSAFASLAFQNLIKVYGITTANVVSELSPGVRGLRQRITTTRGGLAGCGNGKDIAWLYYLSNAEVPQLKQFQLATGASVTPQGPPTPDAESSLSAWYKDVDESRGVVYQNNGNTNLKFWEVQKDGSQSNSEINNTTQAAKKTPLATVVKGDKVFLYFMDSSNALIRAERSGSSSWTNQKTDNTNDWSLNPITATLSLSGKYIIVRQQFPEGEDGIFEFPDDRDV